MIIGIAYHSPLDVVALFPTTVKYSMNPDDEVDVLISSNVERHYKAKIQIVFTSARNLFKENLSILDHGAWGKVIVLTNEHMDEILRKKNISVVPDWVNFKTRG